MEQKKFIAVVYILLVCLPGNLGFIYDYEIDYEDTEAFEDMKTAFIRKQDDLLRSVRRKLRGSVGFRINSLLHSTLAEKMKDMAKTKSFEKFIDKLEKDSGRDLQTDMKVYKTQQDDDMKGMTEIHGRLSSLDQKMTQQIKEVFNPSEIGLANLTSETLMTEIDILRNVLQIQTTENELDKIRENVTDEISQDVPDGVVEWVTTPGHPEAFWNFVNILNSEANNISRDIFSLTSLTRSSGTSINFQIEMPRDNYLLHMPNGNIIRFVRVVHNTGGGYSTSTGVFTAPVTGSYCIWALFRVFNSVTFGATEIEMYKDGEVVSKETDDGPPNQTIQDSRWLIMVDLIYLKAGSKTWFKKVRGAEIVANFRKTMLGGVFISPDKLNAITD